MSKNMKIVEGSIKITGTSELAGKTVQTGTVQVVMLKGKLIGQTITCTIDILKNGRMFIGGRV